MYIIDTLLEFKSYFINTLDFILLFLFFLAILKFIKETKSAVLVKGFLVILVAYALSYLFQLKTIVWFLNFLAPSLITGIIIIFQAEFRVVLSKLGSLSFFSSKRVVDTNIIDQVVEASKYLSSKKRGALIVIEKNLGVSNIKLGVELNAVVSKELLITIFEYDTLMHDGAVVIQNNILTYAGCILPLTQREDVSQNFGTRHRAAIGISEVADVIVVVVSEESRAISLVYSSIIYYDLNENKLKESLIKLLTENKPKEYEE